MTTLALRAATQEDVPFIKSSWLESYRYGRAVRGVPNSIYYAMHDKVSQFLLADGEVTMVVDEADPSVIAGWACYKVEGPMLVLHYVYVRGSWRRKGVATRLLQGILALSEATLVAYTHDTEAWYRYLGPKREKDYLGAAWVYDPYQVMKALPEGWAGL